MPESSTRAWAAAVMIVAAGCGSGIPTTKREPPRVVDRADCDQVLAHVDAVMGAEFVAGAEVPFGDETIKREVLSFQCAGFSLWSRTCMALVPEATDFAGCAPGFAPALMSYAGPSPYQREKFEECVAAAPDHAALKGCSYYKDGPGRIPLHPDERPAPE